MSHNNTTCEARKPRILYVGEASFLATGYSTYSREVLSRLHATGKYEIAELACYATDNDPRRLELPWKFFGNAPIIRTPEYDSNQIYKFGHWSFNDVCLKFRPDIVFDIRDHWVLAFEERSPFRPFFNWAIMPAIDSIPLHEKWLATCINSDACLSYTDWGQGVLNAEGGGLVNTVGVAPPGADLDTFAPMDKAKLRKKFGFEDDVFIVGTVMRNQARKLYPNLISDFATFLKTTSPEIAAKTYLYLHTTYPDEGWDIPRLIKNSGISNKILVTYKCRNCSNVFPSFYQDARGACQECNSNQAGFPNVQSGVDRLTLACVINLFDVYVQYATNEGFGMPQVEAASCAVPVMATDYSAMSDVVRKVNGYPIKVHHYYMEPIIGTYRAVPDGIDFVSALNRFFSLSPTQRREKGFQARMGVERHYTWEKTAHQWEKVLDSLPLRDWSQTWDSPSRFHQPVKPPNEFPSNEALVKWSIINILGRPEMADSYLALRLIRDLNWGVTATPTGDYLNEDSFASTGENLRNFGVDDMLAELRELCALNNQWESKRCQGHGLID